jgi:hypothetical protein
MYCVTGGPRYKKHVLCNPKQAIMPARIGARNAFYPAHSYPLTDGTWERCGVRQLSLGSRVWSLFLLRFDWKFVCGLRKRDWAEALLRW